MSSHHNVLPGESAVPIPVAYPRQISYDSSQTNPISFQTPLSEDYTSKGSNVVEKEELLSARPHKPLFIFLRDSRIYIRILAVLIMIVSFSLILTAVISFSKAQNKPLHPLDTVPQPAPITDQPCIVFTGISAMNLVFSTSILLLSCISSKFRKSNDAINAAFAIISAIGFATSMGACFFLNKETKVKNDLWKWSCGNHEKGIVSDAIDFRLVCNVVGIGWKLGLVQASLELLTFLISVTAFILLKYTNFVNFGKFGKIF